MSVGLSGSHGVGKTTLAKKIAETNDWEFLPSRAGDCFTELELPFTGLSFEQLMQVQELILNRFIEQAQKQSGMWISDRTPLDFAAYVLATHGENASDEQMMVIKKYLSDCFNAASKYVSMIMYIPPGIPFVNDGTRPEFDEDFQTKYHNVCMAFMHDSRLFSMRAMLAESTTDLDLRVTYVNKVWEIYVQNAVEVGTKETKH